jgi:hypothetical protein
MSHNGAIPSSGVVALGESMAATVRRVGSEEARNLTITLASVRRSNCTDGFPVYSFHDDALLRGVIEGIKAIKFTNAYSPYSLLLGSCRQPVFRQRLDRCDRSRCTIQLSSRLKSFRM